MNTVFEKLKKLVVSPSLYSLWQWSRGYRRAIALFGLGQVAAALLGLSFTLATRALIDSAMLGLRSEVIRDTIALAVVIGTQLVLGFLLRLIQTRLHALMLRDIRRTLIRAGMHKQYPALSGIHSGELTGKILSDSATVADGVVDILPELLCLATQFLGAGAILFFLNPSFLLALIAAGILGAGLLLFFGKRMKVYHNQVRTREDQLQASIQETMQNLRVIKASGIEQQRTAVIGTHQDSYVRSQLEQGRFSAAANTGVNLVFRLSWLYAMLWGCYGMYRHTLSYGTLTAMLQLVAQVQGPIAGLGSMLGRAYATVSSAERLDALLQLPDESDQPPLDAEAVYPKLREIRIENLSFAYDRETVLHDVSVSIRPGQIAAITGDSGGGKSTLFSLLLGLYPPQSGQIRFVCEDAVYTAGSRTRSLFSYVPQGNTLFSGTIRQNIAMFRPEATEQEILEAARMACIDRFIASQSLGLDTPLGEKGLGLSEGQAQRIAVARALLSNAPILLLDEATSALDERTEAKLLENIRQAHQKTCLIVTHRPAALAICTARLRVENGTVC